MQLKRKMSAIFAALCIGSAMMCATVSAEDSCTVHFDFDNPDLDGVLRCEFTDTNSGEVITENYTITNGLVDVVVDNDTKHYVLDYTVFNANNEGLLSKRAYAVTSLPSELDVKCTIASTEAYKGLGDEYNIRQVADLLGVSYDEAAALYEADKQANKSNVSLDDNATTNTNNTVGTGIASENTGAVSNTASKVVECSLNFEDVQYLYPIEYITLTTSSGSVDVPVVDNKFTCEFASGVYTLTCKGCQPVTLNITNEVAVNIAIKPERVMHLVKDTDNLHVTVDGYEWQGELKNNVASFAILPTDKVIIDDIDGMMFEYPLSSGVHEYTLNLNTGRAVSTLLNDEPVQDMSEDNPFGIPQTNDTTADNKELYKDLVVVVGFLTGFLLSKISVNRRKDDNNE